MAKLKEKFQQLRDKFPWLDHLVQAGTRYTADAGNQMAAAVTYFSFLSLFPLLLLAVSVLGFVLRGNPELTARVIENISAALPGEAGTLVTDTIKNSAGPAGITGILGLLYSGLGWIDNLRTAIRTVWHQNIKAGNFFVTKAVDIVILIGLGATIAVSVAITGVGNAATSFVIEQLGLEGVPGMFLVTKAVAITLGAITDILVILWLFTRLPKVNTPWRRVLKGAVFFAVGFEILKIVGAYYIGRTAESPTYGPLGAVVGTLIWINLVSRFLIFTAVWTVTAPYDDDIAPSGSADRQTAREAGIPEEFADVDTADNLQAGGKQGKAPTPLMPALTGKPGVGYEGADRSDPTGEGVVDAAGGRGGKAGRRRAGRTGGTASGTGTDAVDPYPSEGDSSQTGGTEHKKVSPAVVAGAVGAALGARTLLRRRHDDENAVDDDLDN